MLYVSVEVEFDFVMCVYVWLLFVVLDVIFLYVLVDGNCVLWFSLLIVGLLVVGEVFVVVVLLVV